jgi:hypothetical protein
VKQGVFVGYQQRFSVSRLPAENLIADLDAAVFKVRFWRYLLVPMKEKNGNFYIHLSRPPAIRLVHFGLGGPDVPMDQLALCPCFYASD